MRTNSSCWIWKIPSRKHQAAIETSTPTTATTTSSPTYGLLPIITSACSDDSSGGAAPSAIGQHASPVPHRAHHPIRTIERLDGARSPAVDATRVVFDGEGVGRD